jgi:hypothetical protein
MLLSARILNNVADVNHFETVVSLEVVQGDAPDIYIALVDASVEKHNVPPYRRYVAPTGSTLKVVIQDIDTAVTLTKYATRPFSGDQSIWKVAYTQPADITSIASMAGTYALKLTLTEPGTTLPDVWSDIVDYNFEDLVSLADGTLWRSLQSSNLNNVPGVGNVWWSQMAVVFPKVLSGFVSQAISIARSSPEF